MASKPSKRVVYCRYIRTRNGRVLDARDYGRLVWRFEVDDEPKKPNDKR